MSAPPPSRPATPGARPDLLPLPHRLPNRRQARRPYGRFAVALRASLGPPTPFRHVCPDAKKPNPRSPNTLDSPSSFRDDPDAATTRPTPGDHGKKKGQPARPHGLTGPTPSGMTSGNAGHGAFYIS